ncbi:MAG: STAS domain-containing protein [Solirubrobacteraceae bacterium]
MSASTNPIGRLRRPGLSVEPLELERETVLVLRGEFDLTGVEVFKAAVAHVRPGNSLVLDLHELTFMDSSGLGALVVLHERAGSEGWSLMLSAPQPSVAMVLRISGLAQRLTIIESTG